MLPMEKKPKEYKKKLRMKMRELPHLSSRIFNRPLLIEPDKAEIILGVFLSKLDGAEMSAGSKRNDSGRFQIVGSTAIIPVHGTLVNRGLTMGPVSGSTSYEYIERSVKEAVEDTRIQNIVFDVDSPGGEADGAFDLSDFIYEQRQKKKMVAFVDGLCASAAYAVASAAHEIHVTKTSIVGSIGVIAIHADYTKQNEKKGVKVTVIKQGTRKAELNPFEELSDVAKTKMEEQVSSLYADFVSLVSRNRGIAEQTIKDTESQVYTGAESISLGLSNKIVRRTMFMDSVSSVDNKQTITTLKESTMPNNENVEQKPSAVENTVDVKASMMKIINLCNLSGFPEKAASFLSENKTEEEVTSILMKAQEEKDRSYPVNNSQNFSQENGLLKACQRIAANRLKTN
jgi:signal peptide peptidase SppA